MSSPPRPAKRERQCRRGRLEEIGTEIFYPSGLRHFDVMKDHQSLKSIFNKTDLNEIDHDKIKTAVDEIFGIDVYSPTHGASIALNIKGGDGEPPCETNRFTTEIKVSVNRIKILTCTNCSSIKLASVILSSIVLFSFLPLVLSCSCHQSSAG